MEGLLKKIGVGVVLISLSILGSGCGAYNMKPDLVYENGKFRDRRPEVMSSIVGEDIDSRKKTTLSNDRCSPVVPSLVYRVK
jgi:hypothetical protein